MKISNPIISSLLAWFDANARDLPWRRTCDPYAIWISEIMLQQTQVKTVIPYWERWMKRLPDVQALALAQPETVLKLWEGLGYYSRARNAQAAARLIAENHGAVFPTTFEAVLGLPGIGPYTAGAICSIAFNQPTPILDGNVVRLLSRLFGVEGNVKEKATNARLWELARMMVERAAEVPQAGFHISDCAMKMAENFKFQSFNFKGRRCSMLNQSLMELGALVCLPQQPNCAVCPVSEACFAKRENRVDELPKVEKRAPATKRRFIAFVVERKGRYWVRQRPAGVVNGHLWEFPNIEIAPEEANIADAAKPFVLVGRPLCSFNHSITRYRILLEAYQAKLPLPDALLKEGKWCSLAELEELAFTSAHRKVLERIQTLIYGETAR